ncbi:TRAP transporter small permease subunit [Leucobacter sp. gxy201]|uniref:TRAP transporter small permease n=1 Tax=Leucobacter sp. gxy201 TaxID=2957200 RepID=UPI003DA1A26E
MKQKELWRPLLRLERAVLIITSILTAGLVTVGVITRYVLHVDFLGMEEMVSVIAIWLYWVGGLYASRNDNHIQGNLIENLLKSPRAKRVHRLFVLGVSLLVLVVFAKWSFDYVLWSVDRGARTSALKIPLVLAHVPLLVGFVMMFLYTGYHAVRTFRVSDDNYDDMMEEVRSWR